MHPQNAMLETPPELRSARPRTGGPNATFGCTEATIPSLQRFHAHSINASVGPSPDEATSATWHYQSNQQYSITAVTTSSGSVAERYAYTAYGQPTILDGSVSVLSSSAINNRYTYTGREWDQTLDLYHFRARWMSGIAGRFMGRNPIGYERNDFNTYLYCGSRPFIAVGAEGLKWEIDVRNVDERGDGIDHDITIDISIHERDAPRRSAFQIWMYHEIRLSFVDSECKSISVPGIYERKLDVFLNVAIRMGNRLVIVDHQAAALKTNPKVCMFFFETSTYIGFNEVGVLIPGGTNQKVTDGMFESIRKMEGPVAQYWSVYTYVNPDFCSKCCPLVRGLRRSEDLVWEVESPWSGRL